MKKEIAEHKIVTERKRGRKLINQNDSIPLFHARFSMAKMLWNGITIKLHYS